MKSSDFPNCCEENFRDVCEKFLPRLNKHDDVIEWNFMKIAPSRNEELVAPLQCTLCGRARCIRCGAISLTTPKGATCGLFLKNSHQSRTKSIQCGERSCSDCRGDKNVEPFPAWSEVHAHHFFFRLSEEFFHPLLGCARFRGRCWAAIRLSHRSEPSGRAVRVEVDGLDIGGRHGRRFVLLHHTHRPQRRTYPFCTSRSGNVRYRCGGG